MGNGFWCGLEDDSGHLQEEDRELLKQLFNPELSDRRSEGDLFIAPDTSYTTVTRLRGLLKDEEKVRARRKEHFFCEAFDMNNPGSLFPTSWVPSFETNMEKHKTLCPRPEYTGEAADLLKQVLKMSVPVFDRITEEGLRFMVYQLGSLEVRTTQDLSGEETIGAVFSVSVAAKSAKRKEFKAEDKIVKVTEYVERACQEIRKGPSVNYYVVLETQRGEKIVTECLSDGTVTWEADTGSVDDRNSLAKVTRSADTRSRHTVGELMAQHTAVAQAGSASARKRYCRAIYNCAQ
jgi:hypothetical protein